MTKTPGGLVEIEVATHTPYRVAVGSGALGLGPAEFGARKTAVITDTTVAPLHLHRLGTLAEGPVLALDPGEGSKRLSVLERVLDFLAAVGLDRSSVVVTLGGGVVGDLGGLAASLYMRGIDVVHGPTTLLAQVDAAVGGKTAVNLGAGKNLAGTFHQPVRVLADPQALGTLPREEFESGLGEVVKSALIGDPDLFELLEREGAGLGSRDARLLTDVVARCVRVKGEIVAADEREAGERKRLNLGHTFAHAIELVAGYGVLPHGLCVGTGLALALAASSASGHLEDADLARRTGELLASLGLCPTLASLRARYGVALPGERLLAGMRHDKKGEAGEPAFVLPTALGRVVLDAPVEPAVLALLLQ